MISINIPIIETERLRLRAPALADFDAEVEFFASDRSKMVGGPLTPDLVWRALASLIGHWHFRGYGFWAVDEKNTGQYCGRVGLWFPEGWPEPEIGWSLMQEAEGRGIAREAAIAARDYAAQKLGWKTAISLVSHANHRSIKLAQRLGAEFERDYSHPNYGEMQIYRHPASAFSGDMTV